MPIQTEIVVNVVTNCVNIAAVLFAVYAAMYVFEVILKFSAGAFDNVKVFDSLTKGKLTFGRLGK